MSLYTPATPRWRCIFGHADPPRSTLVIPPPIPAPRRIRGAVQRCVHDTHAGPLKEATVTDDPTVPGQDPNVPNPAEVAQPVQEPTSLEKPPTDAQPASPYSQPFQPPAAPPTTEPVLTDQVPTAQAPTGQAPMDPTTGQPAASPMYLTPRVRPTPHRGRTPPVRLTLHLAQRTAGANPAPGAYPPPGAARSASTRQGKYPTGQYPAGQYPPAQSPTGPYPAGRNTRPRSTPRAQYPAPGTYPDAKESWGNGKILALVGAIVPFLGAGGIGGVLLLNGKDDAPDGAAGTSTTTTTTTAQTPLRIPGLDPAHRGTDRVRRTAAPHQDQS